MPGLTIPPAAPRQAPASLAIASRWAGSAWLYAREGGRQGLAAGSQLGGSQAGIRASYRLNSGAVTRVALAGRLSTPLNDSAGAEAAAGVDFHPVASAPFRLSIERRVDLGGAARNAWSAYAAGGFYRDLAPGWTLDGYAQTGVVGARRRDLFADGALRLSRAADLGQDRILRIGGGVWGAAQPGAHRLDIGPRAAFSMPVADTTVTAAIEGRFRIAGDAAPGSGVAVTLATDF